MPGEGEPLLLGTLVLTLISMVTVFIREEPKRQDAEETGPQSHRKEPMMQVFDALRLCCKTGPLRPAGEASFRSIQ